MNPIRDYMLEVIINVTKKLYRDSIGKGLFPKKLSQVIINIITKFLAGEFRRGIGDSALKYCLRNKTIPLGE